MKCNHSNAGFFVSLFCILFTLKYCDIENVEDFLVLRLHYEEALQRKWCPVDRFRSLIGNVWWEGEFLERKPYTDRPESKFTCCRIR